MRELHNRWSYVIVIIKHAWFQVNYLIYPKELVVESPKIAHKS